MGQSASDLTKIRCECGASLKVPKSAVGKKAKCPKCSKVFVIAEPPPKEDSAYGLASEPDTSSFLDDLANIERSGTKIEETPDEGRKGRCAKCGADMLEKARICTQCGYDKKSGRTLAAPKAAKPSSPGLLRRLGGAMGGLVKGTLLSGLGAVIGAVAWAVIAIMSGFEIGWIAIGVGALAGYGMLLGYPAQNARAGFVAACMGVFGIFLGKVFIFVFVIRAFMTGDTADIDIQRAIVADAVTEERLSERGIWGDKREEQRDSAYDAAYEDVESWSNQQVRERAAELKSEQDRRDAYGTEEGRTIIRIARHRAERHGEELGIPDDDSEHEKLYAEAFDECKDFSEAQIADEIQAIDDWQEVGRWKNETYVHNYLIDQMVDKTVADLQTEKEAESPDEYWEPSEEELGRFRESAKAEVDDLSHEARLTRSQSMAAEQERENQVATLAGHFALRRGNAEGLPYDNPKRGDFFDEELKRYEALNDDALAKATSTLTAWEENDKWSDDAYVRDNLIYMFALEAIAKQRKEEHADEEGYWTPTPEEWTEFYTAAVDKTEAIPPNHRVNRIREEETRRNREWEERLAVSEREESAELAANTIGWFFAMFEPLDALFILLAISAAWRIALGGSDD